MSCSSHIESISHKAWTCRRSFSPLGTKIITPSCQVSLSSLVSHFCLITWWSVMSLVVYVHHFFVVFRMVLAKPGATADDIRSCCVANVRRIIVTLCDVKCQANGGKAMENVRRYRLSQSLYCKSVGVVATSLAQSQFLWKSAHCSPHLIIYTCGICTCMHVHAYAQMDLRSLKFKIIPLMIQDLLAVCLEHCCAILVSMLCSVFWCFLPFARWCSPLCRACSPFRKLQQRIKIAKCKNVFRLASIAVTKNEKCRYCSLYSPTFVGYSNPLLNRSSSLSGHSLHASTAHHQNLDGPWIG